MTRFRTSVYLAVLGVLALVLVGCGGQQAVSPSGLASTPAPSGPVSSPSAPTGTQSSAGGASATPPCPTSGLAVWLGLGAGGAAAGSMFYPLEFTNVSQRVCHLFGFPGVSAIDGHQLGSAAARDRSRPAQTVTLAPGATAHTWLQIVDVLNFPTGRCMPVTANGLKVYPPNQFSSAEIPFGFKACSRRGETFLSVQPVQPGVGVPGYPDR